MEFYLEFREFQIKFGGFGEDLGFFGGILRSLAEIWTPKTTKKNFKKPQNSPENFNNFFIFIPYKIIGKNKKFPQIGEGVPAPAKGGKNPKLGGRRGEKTQIF